MHMYIICVYSMCETLTFFFLVGYLDPTLGEFSVACRDKLLYVCVIYVYVNYMCIFYVGYLDATLGEFSVAGRDKRAV